MLSYHLCYLLMLLCLFCQYNGQKINLAHKKTVYTCQQNSTSKTSVVEALNSQIVDGEQASFSIFTCANSLTWFLVDLQVAFRIGCVHISFSLSSDYIHQNSKAEMKTSILLKQHFDSNLVPDEQNDDLCWLFEQTVINFDGEVHCLKKPNDPNHRYVSIYNPSSLFMKVFEVNVYEGCLDGFYGPACERVCMCEDNEPCHSITGLCPYGCKKGFEGKTCSEIKLKDYRLNCHIPKHTNETYKGCRDHCYRFNYDVFTVEKTGCKCYSLEKAFTSELCSSLKDEAFSVCPKGFFGYKCMMRCHCEENDFCSITTGKCYNLPVQKSALEEQKKGLGKAGLVAILIMIFLMIAAVYFGVTVKDPLKFLARIRKAKVSAKEENSTQMGDQENIEKGKTKE